MFILLLYLILYVISLELNHCCYCSREIISFLLAVFKQTEEEELKNQLKHDLKREFYLSLSLSNALNVIF